MTAPLTIAVVGRKGGAGKTTTTFNLAGALAAQGLRVLMIDMDPQASLTGIFLGERPDRGISTALLDPRALLDDVIIPVSVGRFDHLVALVPGDRGIESAADKLAERSSGFTRLRKLLAPLVDAAPARVDAVVIDTPPALGFAISAALRAARLAVVPTLTGQHDLDAMVDTVDLVEDEHEEGGARLAAVVPCAVHARELHDRGALHALTASYGALVTAFVPYSPRVRESLAAHIPMVTYDPTSRAAEAYGALATHLRARSAVGGA